jgi:preprotein translocase subunit SecE
VFNKIGKFTSEVKVEMSKVTWSSRQELIHSTIIVLCVMAFLSIFIGIVDFVLSQAVKLILR